MNQRKNRKAIACWRFGKNRVPFDREEHPAQVVQLERQRDNRAGPRRPLRCSSHTGRSVLPGMTFGPYLPCSTLSLKNSPFGIAIAAGLVQLLCFDATVFWLDQRRRQDNTQHSSSAALRDFSSTTANGWSGRAPVPPAIAGLGRQDKEHANGCDSQSAIAVSALIS